VAAAAVVAAVVVAAWFPAAALYHQHQQLSSSTGQLDRLQRQNGALGQEARRLESPDEVARIARQQYQLVDPGQQVYEVLPPPSATGGADAGDPGQQAPVTPSGASELPAGSAVGSGTSGAARHDDGSEPHASPPATGGSPGVLGRILDTLEFWR
jgi:cell division protein FtsB